MPEQSQNNVSKVVKLIVFNTQDNLITFPK